MSSEFVARNGIIALNNTQITGSLNVSGSIVATGDITGSNSRFTGTITAQQLVVQTITSSIIYSSGSNIFGNDITNTQTFTGSVGITGSLIMSGSSTFTGDVVVGISRLLGVGSGNSGFIRMSNAANGSYIAYSGTQIYLQQNTTGQLAIGSNIFSATQLVSATAGGAIISLSNNSTSGNLIGFVVTSSYSQSSATTANTDFLVSRAQTVVGSGAQYLIEARTNNISQFNVSNVGTVTLNGIISGSQPTNNPSSSLLLITGSILPDSGSITGGSAILLNTVMSASANNQTLVGLDITPTFTNGAFTGIENTGLRLNNSNLKFIAGGVNNQIRWGTNSYLSSDGNGTFSMGFSSNSSNGVLSIATLSNVTNLVGGFAAGTNANGSDLTIRPKDGTGTGTPGNIVISLSQITASGAAAQPYVDQVRIFGNTGNVVLQNSASTIDNGYRLSIYSSGSASGSLFVSGSTSLSGSLNVSGSITTTGTLTAQTLVVQTVTSSIIYSSGSNIFGNKITDNQVFTGSVLISGSITVSGSVINNLTASSAQTASYVIPLRQAVIITGSLIVSSSNANTASLSLIGTGSGVFTVDGTSGRLFSVDDSLSGSLFSVNTAAGLPVIEAFSDNTVRIGQYGKRVLFVSQSAVGINKETALNGILDISGSQNITGSLNVTNNINITSGSINITTGSISIAGANILNTALAYSIIFG